MAQKKRGRPAKERVVVTTYLDKDVYGHLLKVVEKGKLSDFINQCIRLVMPK